MSISSHLHIGQVRPNSVSISDGAFGDSGKGSIAAKFNHKLNNGHLVTLRFNGGANAGHEINMFGKTLVMHQLPVGVIEEGATALISRGMVIHPEDLLLEIKDIENRLGAKLPGNLVIDERVPLALDTHRAYEAILSTYKGGKTGSTGKGIAPAYASFYERIAITLKDILASDAKKNLSTHYRYYVKLFAGFGKAFDLADMEIPFYNGKRQVGNESEFIDRLMSLRAKLKPYATSEMYEIIHDTWYHESHPFVIEGAQAPGLDPYHGVYPDVTASRPLIRFIPDATYGMIDPQSIALKLGVVKTTYMSSVGIRKLPTANIIDTSWIQKAFDERGKTTGRLRDIYELSLPILRYLQKIDGYDYLVATHLDASKANLPIPVITKYVDKKTMKQKPYLPYQDYLDTLDVVVEKYAGWDGAAVKEIHDAEKLPKSARAYVDMLGEQIAPVVFATTGPELDDAISWLPIS